MKRIKIESDQNVFINNSKERKKEQTSSPDSISLTENHSVSTSENFAPSVPALKKYETIVLSSDEDEAIPRLMTPGVRRRPIIIHGCNVARVHGKHENTYSCKGIKISIEYFLKMGHTEVTAVIPRYRLRYKTGGVRSTGQETLDVFYKTNQVIFYPSNVIDDRFLIRSAAAKGGIILSNKNFKDLLYESPEFKEIIKKRVLHYVFIKDLLMIPDDPLGRGGPSLLEFLTFPPV